MNSRSLEKIRAAARFIATHSEAARLARQHLSEPVQLALSVLESLELEQKTAPEIARSLGISSESVRQILRALAWNPEDGGIKIHITYGNGKNAGYSLLKGKIIWQEPTT